MSASDQLKQEFVTFVRDWNRSVRGGGMSVEHEISPFEEERTPRWELEALYRILDIYNRLREETSKATAQKLASVMEINDDVV